jgi:hypothetical protein
MGDLMFDPEKHYEIRAGHIITYTGHIITYIGGAPFEINVYIWSFQLAEAKLIGAHRRRCATLRRV